MQVIVTSPWVPVEWIEAHGLEPRGAWFAASDRSIAAPEGVCSFARAMSELASSHPDAPVIFTSACDQMRRAADAAAFGPSSRGFLFNLPATWQTHAVRCLYHSEVRRLGKFLEGLGGRAPTDAGLKAVMEKHEQRRKQVREVMQRGASQPCAGPLADYFKDGAAPTPQTAAAHEDQRVPLALVGGPLLPSQRPLFDAIESIGGGVVLNATEPGERCLLPPLPAHADGELPLPALADHYFDHIVDVFQRPNSRLYEWLAARLTQRRVRGIVLWVHVGCDLWRAEAASLRDAFSLPLLVLESHEVRAGGLRDANRLAAFIELLHHPVQNFVAYATKFCKSHQSSVVRKPFQ